MLPEPVVVGEDVLVLAEPLVVVVREDVLLLGAPGRGRSKEEVTRKIRLLSLSPDPPATLESCANPIEGGLARKTEYTFFCKAKGREISIRYASRMESTNQKGSPDNPGGIT